MARDVRIAALIVGAAALLASAVIPPEPAFARKPEKRPAAAGAEKPSGSDASSAATSAAKAPDDTKTGEADSSTDAASAAAPPSCTSGATPAPTPSDPIVAAACLKLADKDLVAKADKDDVAAIGAFYAIRTGGPVWVNADGFTAKAKAAMAELERADDWGLSASAFILPKLPEGKPATEALGEAEAKLGLELLKYARYARGGRFNPRSLSRILDQSPPIKDPNAVLAEFAATDAPGLYMYGLHPQHVQFERLRQALLKARGPAAPKEKEESVDEALKVKLPMGKLLKPGADHADIALLRQRLKVPAESGAKDTVFDGKLTDAVKAFQNEKGLKQTGSLNNATRTALNGDEPVKKDSGGIDTQRILINMERWRWMPEKLGDFYVWDNIPEYTARVRKGNDEIFKEKIIVGLAKWATPVFSAEMRQIVFNPSWGVPDGIKVRELLPRLRSAGGGFLFFGGGGGDVLRAYGLTAYRGGQEVDPDSVDWGSVDIRNYSFVQPPGEKNPLGIVKFLFPNKHDVYMHDTTQRELFAQSQRALSHGCMRVENPRKLAAILLAEDKGWSPEKVAQAISGGGEIKFDKSIPVHVTYFTALVDDNGKVSTFPDIYGHDSRLAAALTGRPLRLEPVVETVSDDTVSEPPAGTGRKKKKTGPSNSAPATLADAVSGLLAN